MLIEMFKIEELIDLEFSEIFYCLYNEEEVCLFEVEVLKFGCICFKERCV